MKFLKQKIKGVFLIKPEPFKDKRVCSEDIFVKVN